MSIIKKRCIWEKKTVLKHEKLLCVKVETLERFTKSMDERMMKVIECEGAHFNI